IREKDGTADQKAAARSACREDCQSGCHGQSSQPWLVRCVRPYRCPTTRPGVMSVPSTGSVGQTCCSACGRAMVCGRENPAGCWCASLPPLPKSAIAPGQTCLCEECLRSRGAPSEVRRET